MQDIRPNCAVTRFEIGFLLGTRRYQCSQPLFAVGSLLKVYAKRIFQSENGLASFECHIDDENGQLATANVTVFQPADAKAVFEGVRHESERVGHRLEPRHRQGDRCATGARRLRYCRALPQPPGQKLTAWLEAIVDLGRQARVLQFDIGDRALAAATLAADIAQHGCYYGVVCNAGVVRDNVFPAMSGEDWDAVLKTNLDGFYNVLNPLIMPMVRRRAPGPYCHNIVGCRFDRQPRPSQLQRGQSRDHRRDQGSRA